jgi:predicted amidohydrolase
MHPPKDTADVMLINVDNRQQHQRPRPLPFVVMTEHPAASSCYYYTPQGLLASYLSLKHKEEEEALAALPTFNDPSASPIDHAANHQHHLRSERLVVAAVQLTSPPSTMAVHTGSVIPTSTTPIISALSQTSTNTLHHSDVHSFWTAAQEAVLQAAQQGANVILLPELFMGPYFCQSQEYDLMTQLPESVQDSFVIRRMQQFAQHLQVVLIISMYEKKNNMRYNSVVVIDADGSIVGTYRKSHIPDGPGYQEKFYFSPGGDGADGGGLRVFPTRHGKIGVAICWDQWFPEVARILALQGADVLLYPTAIGSEPSSSQEEGEGIKSSADHWQRVMQGHAAANVR